jgi:hypothetical protein
LPHSEIALVGRDPLVSEVTARLETGENVLLVGAEDVGKSAVARLALSRVRRRVELIDPFERIATRHAGAIRRALERDVTHLAAGRSLDRHRMGAVRRIAFWFSVVRVPPLVPSATVTLLSLIIERRGLDPPSDEWFARAARVARGLPGRAIAIAEIAGARAAASGRWMTPEAAWTECCFDRARRVTTLTTPS